MVTILDRYILRSLLVNYIVALGVMLSLYVVLDMFINMDEFTEQGYPLTTVVANMIDYYWPNLFLYFAQLSGVITVFACMSTIARMRKLNEMTAMLASGVSLHRIAGTVIVFGLLTTALLVIDTEWLIPTVAHKLARTHDEADGNSAYEVLFLQDGFGGLLSAGNFHPAKQELRRLLVLTRDEAGAITSTLEADRATWEPPGSSGRPGGWRLERGRKRMRVFNEASPLGPEGSFAESYPTFYESDLSPSAIQLQQEEGWLRFLSLAQLRELEAKPLVNLAEIIRTRHARVAAAVLSLVMLLLGLPFFLDRCPTTVLSDTGKCMVACGLCYVVAFVGQNVRTESASALPFWIPIFIFATLAIVLIDRIRT